MTCRFLIVTMPVPGHVAPFAPLVRELLRRGHEVVWYGSRHFQKSIEATGARFAPLVRPLDYGDSRYEEHFPERAAYGGLRKVVFDFEKLFVDVIPGMVEDLRDILRDYPADVLLGDPAVAATRILSERGAPPAAVLNITVLSFETPELAAFGLGLPFDNSFFGRLRNRLTYLLVDHVIFRSVNRAYRQIARRHDWPARPFRPSLSAFLHLQPMVREFEYPLASLPPQLHFIGVLLPEAPRDFEPPSWWERVVGGDKPVVLVTQGTIATDADELIRPTLAALADESVHVIAATGDERGEDLGFPIPANAVVERFIPFAAVMPHIAIYITNGGYGGICIALAHGVPVIAAGTTEDKMEVANRVAYSGVGLNLRTNRPSPTQLRSAVRRMLTEPIFAARARSIRDELAKHDAASEAAVLLERLAQTRQPVVRR
jgi:MGT family glycosyltransferase